MTNSKKLYKIKVILSLSNINADFLQLILCMFVSHYLIGNPLYGAALFLFNNIWILYFEGNLRHLKYKRGEGPGVMMWILLTFSLLAGMAIIFLYPVVGGKYEANYVSFFVLIVALRNIMTYWMTNSYNRKKKSNRVLKILFQLFFLLPCIVFAFWLMEGTPRYIVMIGFAFTGFLLSYESSTMVSFGKYIAHLDKDKIGEIFSYKVFSNMALYSQIAFSLGVLMYVCYISFSQETFSVWVYLVMALWLVFVLILSELFTWVANKQGWVMNLNLFLLGAGLWILGSVQMYRVTDWIGTAFWTFFWGFGLACITAVTNRYNKDFKLVARIANKKVADRDLYFRNMLTQLVAVIISYGIMLCVVTVWSFVIPNSTDAGVPALSRQIMMQLPVLFMLISIFFALKQPLDERIRQKLINYNAGTNQNDPTKKNLEKRLIKESRVRFGIKIIAGIVRPFLHLKVSGKENIDPGNFPSIFVCNHGLFYGPIAAVIYLPTYFRPWVDKKMVDIDLSAQEIYDRQLYRWPLLSGNAKMKISRIVAQPVTWALNSFNPIPVQKNSLHGIVQTFDDTVTVLTEGDNVLIFPEKPKKVKKGNKMTVEHETNTVGNLYTGFASIGKLYYEQSGKALYFYPIYANKKGHTFKIGEPVIYDPDNQPKEEKKRIADQLHDKMLELKNG